eukprot:1353998-Amorphochlora_amoeboformis.AAC.2
MDPFPRSGGASYGPDPWDVVNVLYRYTRGRPWRLQGETLLGYIGIKKANEGTSKVLTPPIWLHNAAPALLPTVFDFIESWKLELHKSSLCEHADAPVGQRRNYAGNFLYVWARILPTQRSHHVSPQDVVTPA